jgi:hypothetical protein
MQEPDDVRNLPEPPGNRGSFRWGTLLIVAAVICGGGCTIAMYIGESLMLPIGRSYSNYYGTMLAAAATVALVVAGALLNSAQTTRKLATAAFWLAALSMAVYVFAYVVCLVAP